MISEDVENGTVLRVTMTLDYLIPAYDSNPQGTIEEWVSDKYPLGNSHAYRDGSRIGNSEKVVSYKSMTWQEYKIMMEKQK